MSQSLNKFKVGDKVQVTASREKLHSSACNLELIKTGGIYTVEETDGFVGEGSSVYRIGPKHEACWVKFDKIEKA